MRSARSWVALGSAGLAVSAMSVAMGIPTASAGTPHRSTLSGTLSPAVQHATSHSAIAGSSRVNFDLTLKLSHPAAATSFVRQVSSPGSASYRHYLSDAQWLSRFGPTTASVKAAQSWLRRQGFTVGAVPRTRLFVAASGTAAQVEKAFGTGLANYTVGGHTMRLATKTLSVPSAIGGVVSGVVGVNQYRMTPSLARMGHAVHSAAAPFGSEPPPPAWVREPAALLHVLRVEDRHG